MQKRRLQIFLSSTYEDLIDERLAAMEAILAAGHIPAAMEQFSLGDETALERIKVWIEESDAFILILGGRYGSIEPHSGKSYMQLEYEYAGEKKKPFFALVVSEKHHEQRVKERGLAVDEREHQDKYKEFRTIVKQKLCGFWNDRKDIKAAILQKLPEWAQRSDLVGWVRGEAAASPEVMNELARLSRENSELRAKASNASETFTGLSFDEFVRLLSMTPVTSSEAAEAVEYFQAGSAAKAESITNLLLLFEAIYNAVAGGQRIFGQREPAPLGGLLGCGLLERKVVSYGGGGIVDYSVTPTGQRLRVRLLAQLLPPVEAQSSPTHDR